MAEYLPLLFAKKNRQITYTKENTVEDVLSALFDSDSEDEEFYGFETEQACQGHLELKQLFETDDEEEEFLGFSNIEISDMNLIFQSDDDEDEFFGF